jgi:hypothetical protein
VQHSVALSAGIGTGILKVRLYDIGRLISRTISCSLLRAILAACSSGSSSS